MKYILIILLLVSCKPQEINTNEMRIVSLAPSITETIYALGQEHKLVGRTDFCAKGKNIPSVGTMTPSLEKIISLQPSLVISLSSDTKSSQDLQKAGIKNLPIQNSNLEQIYHSFATIAKACAVPDQGQQLIDECKKILADLAKKQNAHKRVLLLISSLRDNPHKLSPWVAGPKTFYGEILEALNTTNAAASDSTFYQMSSEELLQANPDVIIIIGPKAISEQDLKDEHKAWDQLRQLKAVQSKDIHYIGNSHIMIPGPSITQTMRDLSNVISEK